jgi:hypothetical protein
MGKHEPLYNATVLEMGMNCLALFCHLPFYNFSIPNVEEGNKNKNKIPIRVIVGL